ncbi:hypothetical protein VNI00_010358 [Paramarasmius palmivorus]|uniref:Uncharacterized protein n=1 Tax=Paramarasmius palmivorus TaxID=297713 RepID=A0AAW0CM91_9AGAR
MPLSLSNELSLHINGTKTYLDGCMETLRSMRLHMGTLDVEIVTQNPHAIVRVHQQLLQQHSAYFGFLFAILPPTNDRYVIDAIDLLYDVDDIEAAVAKIVEPCQAEDTEQAIKAIGQAFNVLDIAQHWQLFSITTTMETMMVTKKIFRWDTVLTG